MRKLLILGLCCVLLVLSLPIYRILYSQRPGRTPELQPFRGITTDGKITTGLFKIKQTGVSTEPVRKAAEAFLKGLTDEQALRTMFPVKNKEWRMWDNRHFYQREGVGFDEMTERQRKLAFDLMRVSLSAKQIDAIASTPRGSSRPAISDMI